ncbi:hypothetical protein QXB71_002688 [Vibrio cholerae]|nr:hypothetical protein [Vibrio cholerae]
MADETQQQSTLKASIRYLTASLTLVLVFVISCTAFLAERIAGSGEGDGIYTSLLIVGASGVYCIVCFYLGIKKLFEVVQGQS